jgi:hypothetical protein
MVLFQESFDTMAICKFAGEQRPEKRMKTQGENVHMIFFLHLTHACFYFHWLSCVFSSFLLKKASHFDSLSL